MAGFFKNMMTRKFRKKRRLRSLFEVIKLSPHFTCFLNIQGQTLNPISFFWFGILRRHLFDTIFQIFTFFSYQILKLTQKSGEKNPENLVRLVTYKDIVRYGKNRFHGSLPTPVPFFG